FWSPSRSLKSINSARNRIDQSIRSESGLNQRLPRSIIERSCRCAPYYTSGTRIASVRLMQHFLVSG
ncbi:MAG: hypothetical protein L0219_15785, partial [Phycisphaerales bacterium]|nr:hypothetical protein [Phycisphaerales bacterium]